MVYQKTKTKKLDGKRVRAFLLEQEKDKDIYFNHSYSLSYW